MTALAVYSTFDVRVRVGFGLCEAAAETLVNTSESRLAAIEWLTGRHPGWEGLHLELPGQVRDRMRRAAGDLAFEMPGADVAAAEMLVEADAWLTEVAG